MTRDRFWETFWISFLGIFVISIVASGALFVSHINSLNSAAVGAAFDSTKDPFANTLYKATPSIVDGYIYRNALPIGLGHWAWDATAAWSTQEQIYEGSGSLRANFIKPWSGVGINNFEVTRQSYQGISLAVYPDVAVEDLYLEVYDSQGISQGRQSLSWYLPDGKLVPNAWQVVSIPLLNLIGPSATKTITGVALSSKNAGVAYVDAIKFEGTVAPHAPWVAPKDGGPPYNPFATSTPAALPYTASFSEEDFSRWYPYYGLFKLGKNSFEIGPKPNETSDTVSVLKGGSSWSDYHAEVVLDWGITSVFSILTRVTGPDNFASCAFSYYGQTAQIYYVKNGASTQLAQTPALSIRHFSPWENVSVGASVQGKWVNCYVNGDKVLSAEIPTLSPTGTLGLEAWDQNTYASLHTIKSIEVKQLVGE
jgi:hypothetical protein